MTSRFGFWAAFSAFAASVAYGILQILQVLHVLPDPWDRILIFAPSLVLKRNPIKWAPFFGKIARQNKNLERGFDSIKTHPALAPAFVLTMAAVHENTPSHKRVYSLSAVALAIMYGVLVSIVYITQLGVVIPRDLQGVGPSVAYLACCGQHQFMTGLDLLGYTLMSLSTLFAALVFVAKGPQRPVRLWLAANGALAPVLLGQLVWPGLIRAGALWLITFPVAMMYLALSFKRGRGIPESSP
ncbi:hypothetical protein [Asticcacaulis sp. AC402]|uniref:hypothetical protein n=1 Tax=Asticcacaulis sp. AC402 TaxID=1282361 RepID=UPI0003C40BE9|nr:hypothetical protein [Asticcacaulis sp. AC402]ESQ76088.1 hypothetical protein ABAC402_06475 [Asticcacaulis sp. AC402]